MGHTANIRAQFPQPLRAEDAQHLEGEYCVLSALCRYTYPDTDIVDFPIADDAWWGITECNEAIPEETAIRLAGILERLNDAGKFARAWRLLERAIG